MKKISSLLLAVAMLFTLSVSCFARTEIYAGGGKITIEPNEERKIEFTGTFDGPFYIAFGDQGQVVWSGLEAGIKDFSFNLDPIDSIISKHPDVEFINFPNAPTFIATATVQFAIPVNDMDNPSLYMVEDDGTIKQVPNVNIVGSSNKKFEFRTNKLAKSYIISSVDLNYEMAAEIQDTADIPEVPDYVPPVETTPEPTPVEPPPAPSPQTGVEDMPYFLMIGAGCIGLAMLALTKKKKD